MPLQWEWCSSRGARRKKTQDYCAIAERPKSSIYVVVDGATRGPKGGELARDLARTIADNFIEAEEMLTLTDINNLLMKLHDEYRTQFCSDSASYLIMLESDDGRLQSFQLGDCRLGYLKQGTEIRWVSQPHCLANAIAPMGEQELRDHPNRHILTRSFRPSKFMKPEYREFENSEELIWIIATDGFWAELDENEQRKYVMEGSEPNVVSKDDRSCLILCSGKHRRQRSSSSSRNLYLNR